MLVSAGDVCPIGSVSHVGLRRTEPSPAVRTAGLPFSSSRDLAKVRQLKTACQAIRKRIRAGGTVVCRAAAAAAAVSEISMQVQK